MSALPEPLEFKWSDFAGLTNRQLHDLLKMRQDIFVVEQQSLYADIDGKDPDALHCLILNRVSGTLVGAIRVFLMTPTGRARIGRVVIGVEGRGKGLGRLLMREGIGLIEAKAPGTAIEIGAQAHLEAFYQALGFQTTSAPYDEDGILHIDMERPARPAG